MDSQYTHAKTPPHCALVNDQSIDGIVGPCCSCFKFIVNGGYALRRHPEVLEEAYGAYGKTMFKCRRPVGGDKNQWLNRSIPVEYFTCGLCVFVKRTSGDPFASISFLNSSVQRLDPSKLRLDPSKFDEFWQRAMKQHRRQFFTARFESGLNYSYRTGGAKDSMGSLLLRVNQDQEGQKNAFAGEQARAAMVLTKQRLVAVGVPFYSAMENLITEQRSFHEGVVEQLKRNPDFLSSVPPSDTQSKIDVTNGAEESTFLGWVQPIVDTATPNKISNAIKALLARFNQEKTTGEDAALDVLRQQDPALVAAKRKVYGAIEMWANAELAHRGAAKDHASWLAKQPSVDPQARKSATKESIKAALKAELAMEVVHW